MDNQRIKLIPKQDEIFSDTKKRLEARTGIKGKGFEKIKFSVVRRNLYGRPIYLADGKLKPCDRSYDWLTYMQMMYYGMSLVTTMISSDSIM